MELGDRWRHLFLVRFQENSINDFKLPYTTTFLFGLVFLQGDPFDSCGTTLSFTGGEVGYIGFDYYQYFEPSIQGDLPDPIGIPDAIFMLCDTLVIFDRVRYLALVVSHFRSDVKDAEGIKREYMKAAEEVECTMSLLNDPRIPQVPQPPIDLSFKTALYPFDVYQHLRY
ncbi:hypothetical protein LRAMOSA04003 [Lichtheimia ramosa]|uniref:Anthranilate synthase component I N-terminal domain-containing protein n=1 Tax=Lichtheimia ramosa TaxID=688394 RepID=A0A077WWT2_9FUNG|nr:hypothetical protein LRAMOSA04003 [Lichtheimia ramosa]